jgi:hypothetical protein
MCRNSTFRKRSGGVTYAAFDAKSPPMAQKSRDPKDFERIERYKRSPLTRLRAYFSRRRKQPAPFALAKPRAQRSSGAVSRLTAIALGEPWNSTLDWASVAQALEISTSENAYETTAMLVDGILEQFASCPSELRRGMLRRCVDSFVACGENDSALQLIAQYPGELPKHGYTRALFDGQSPKANPDLFAPYELYRSLRDEVVSPEALIAEIDRHRTRLSELPRLELALFFAYRKLGLPSQEAALGRYLRAEGLAPLRCDISQGGNVLGALSAKTPVVTNVKGKQGPLVSIVCSAFRAEATLRYAISSLLAQTHGDIEILLCDDRSDDGTFTLALELAKRDPRIRLFRSKSNQGTYNVRNGLVSQARGQFITFHDADDYALPERIAMQLAALHATQAKLCVANWIRILPSGLVVSFRDGKEKRLSVVSLMAERELLLSHLPYRSARHSADLEMYEKLACAVGPTGQVRVQAPLIFGLWSEQSLTRAKGAEAFESGYRSLSRRHYAELCFRQRLLGSSAISDEYIDEELRAAGNLMEPSGVEEVTFAR